MQDSNVPSSRIGWKSDDFMIFGAALLVMFAARGLQIFGFHYSTDDYYLNSALTYTAQLRNMLLAQGRPVELLLFMAFDALNIKYISLPTLGGTLYNVSLVFGGMIALRLWSVNDLLRAHQKILIICVLALHPYQMEAMTFQSNLVIAAIVITITFVSLFYSRRGGVYLFLSAIGLAMSFLTYQIAIQYVTVALCSIVVMNFAVNMATDQPKSWRDVALSPELVFPISAVVMAIALMLVTVFGCAHLSGVPLDGRVSLLGRNDIWGRICVFVEDLTQEELMFPYFIKVGLFCLSLCGAAFSALRTRKALASIETVGQTGTILLALVGCLVSYYGIVLIGKSWWSPVPRILVGASFYVAAALSLAMVAFPRRIKVIVTCFASLTCLVFISINNEMSVDQTRLNLRDQMMANRIVSRIEALPNFTPEIPVVMVGQYWGFNLKNIRTARGDMNLSAFGSDWSKLHTLREASGYVFQTPSEEQVHEGEKYCASHEYWPHPGSIAMLNASAVVCLYKTAN